MMPHPPMSLLWVADTMTPAPSSLAAYLESIPHVQLPRVSQWPADLGNHDVVISLGGGHRDGGAPDLEGFVRNGGAWLTGIDAVGAVLPDLLGVAERVPFAFHRHLADYLLLGEPLGAPLAGSVKVVAILEAAARSMFRGGTPEVIDGE